MCATVSRRRRSVGRASQDRRQSRMPSPEMSLFFLYARPALANAIFSSNNLFRLIAMPRRRRNFAAPSARTARQFHPARLLSALPLVRANIRPAFKAAFPPTAAGYPLADTACRCVTQCVRRIDSTPLCAIAFGCQASFFWHHILWPRTLASVVIFCSAPRLRAHIFRGKYRTKQSRVPLSCAANRA